MLFLLLFFKCIFYFQKYFLRPISPNKSESIGNNINTMECINMHIQHAQDRERKSLVLNCSAKKKDYSFFRKRLRLCDIKWETTFSFILLSPDFFLPSFFFFLIFFPFPWNGLPSIIFCYFFFLDETMREEKLGGRCCHEVGKSPFIASPLYLRHVVFPKI